MDRQENQVYNDKINKKEKKEPQEDIINIVRKFVDYFERVDGRKLNDHSRESG